jgi:molybdopterin-biosynthesis enzyme MoeA-like protein
MLRRHYRAEDINEARLKMADVPDGATLIENPVSAAPGFQMGNVFVMAGVPRIMQAMFETFRHRLTGGTPMLSRSIATFILEGTMAGPLSAVQVRHPKTEIGSYPFVRDGRLGVSLVVRAADAETLEAAADAVRAAIRALGGEPMEDDGGANGEG